MIIVNVDDTTVVDIKIFFNEIEAYFFSGCSKDYRNRFSYDKSNFSLT